MTVVATQVTTDGAWLQQGESGRVHDVLGEMGAERPRLQEHEAAAAERAVGPFQLDRHIEVTTVLDVPNRFRPRVLSAR